MEDDRSEKARAYGHEGSTFTRHQTRILHALRVEPGLSKAGLSQRLGINSGTITMLISELVDRGLVVTGDYEPSTRGRPALRLRLNPERPLMLGIVLRDPVQIGVVNLQGRLIASEELPLPGTRGRADLRQLLDAVHSTARKYAVAGVGISMHSQVDHATGTVLDAPGFGWFDVPLGAVVEQALKIPAALGRTVEAALMAEDWWGSAPSGDPFVFVVAGPHVMAATKVHGRLMRGASNRAGLMAHTLVDPSGPRCHLCGKPGCLEAVASSRSVIQRYHELHRQAGTTTHMTRSRQTIGSVIAASEDDVLAKQALERAAEQLGHGLVVLVNMINPRVIVLSGELMDAESIVLPKVRGVVRQEARGADVVDIVGSTYRSEAGLVGASTLAFERLFSEPTRDWTRGTTAVQVDRS